VTYESEQRGCGAAETLPHGTDQKEPNDQYLGSLTGSEHTWAAGWSSDVSLLSAPWLILPFLAGATQHRPRPGRSLRQSRDRVAFWFATHTA
jgi:hypothetical protein